MEELIWTLLILLLASCDDKLDADGEIARQYLLNKEYDIISYEGSQEYSFTKEELGDLPHLAICAVQPFSPDSYGGKVIKQEILIVEEHPISKIDDSYRGFSGEARNQCFGV
ncbi:hypothetical protein V1502_11470 [Bacillus sp. SCS-153A]|uniref:hypothetical protein n=1 Tax=Rossellomorea sedimentorum TaxID=3115294 RepID=UPI0039069E91